jgi:hypothetical protein
VVLCGDRSFLDHNDGSDRCIGNALSGYICRERPYTGNNNGRPMTRDREREGVDVDKLLYLGEWRKNCEETKDKGEAFFTVWVCFCMDDVCVVT